MKKILVLGLSDNIGGVETFFHTYYKYLDKKRFAFDFASVTKTIAFEEEYIANGSKVYRLPNFIRRPLGYYHTLKKIIRSEQYDAVHINMLSAANILPIIAAKKAGCPNIIIHSHNAGVPSGSLRRVLDRINRRYLRNCSSIKVACGEKAGEWLFGKGSDFQIIPNAIDSKKFLFSAKSRNEIRKKYGLSDGEILIGTVGRLCEQKNQSFLIDTLRKLSDNYKLMIVGSGDLKDTLIKRAKANGVLDRVVFVENRLDIEKYYSAMDLFAFPSLFEGMPIAPIEAQINGLKCICSSAITRESNLGMASYLELSLEKWTKAIKASKGRNSSARPIPERSAQYDIRVKSKALETLYMSAPLVSIADKKYTSLSYRIGKALVFLSILSFFCGDFYIKIGFTLRPFHIAALLSFFFLIATRKNYNDRGSFSKVDKLFFLFFLASLLGAILSPFFVLNSIKHIIGIALLAYSFLVFKKLYCRYEKDEIIKIASSAGLTIIAVTLVWYFLGLVSLGFNYNIKDVWCYGVRVDRKIPRLISFAYNEPNFVSIYFSTLFAFYIGTKRNLKNIIGLVGSLAIIILTLSRGGYIAFAATLLAYFMFAKISLKDKAKDLIIMAIAGALSFACATAIMNTESSTTPAPSSQKTQQNTAEGSNNETQNVTSNKNANGAATKSAISIMATRFSTSISDSGSGRVVQWERAITTFKNNPITGIGPGNILDYNKSAYGKYAPSHNSYLDTLAEQGIIGASAYLLLIITIAISCWLLRGYTIMPALGFIFLFVSELFLSLTVTDMLFMNILMVDMVEIFWRRERNKNLIGSNRKPTIKPKSANSKCKLSFVVPVYNVEPYLEQCLNSLINQTRNNFEIVIVDDGSTDNSSAICKRYANLYSVVHYYRTDNHGLAAARNYGMKKACGEYIWFIDSDDFLSFNAVEEIETFLSHDIVTVNYFNYYSDDVMTNGNDCGTADSISRYLLNPGFAPLKILRRSFVKTNNISFPEGENYEDVSTMFPLVEKTSDIFHSGRAVYFYRRRNKSICSTPSEKNISDHFSAAKKLSEIRKDNYKEELQYQSVLQYLFIAFELRKNDFSKKTMKKLKDKIEGVLSGVDSNKYLSAGAKNRFYKLYIYNLTKGNWNICLFMNKARNIIITWRRIWQSTL